MARKLALADLVLRRAWQILGRPERRRQVDTVKILTGMIRPDAGCAIVAGFDIVAGPREKNGSACPKPARCTKRCRPTSISS